MQLTFNYNILDPLVFCLSATPALTSLILLSEFRKYEWSYSLNDARQGWIVAFQ
jgi:hypothetical protein